MDDAGRGRDDPEVGEGGLAPLEELVSLLVALELLARVDRQGVGSGEGVDLDRMVDHQVDRDQGFTFCAEPSSPVIETMAARIAARSTTVGTPVKSWRTTLPGTNGISAPPARAAS